MATPTAGHLRNNQSLRQESNLRPRDCWAGALSTQPSRSCFLSSFSADISLMPEEKVRAIFAEEEEYFSLKISLTCPNFEYGNSFDILGSRGIGLCI
ncbi:hypothetical protein EVAR_72909_1, partial [Eumeta japonica]